MCSAVFKRMFPFFFFFFEAMITFVFFKDRLINMLI